jgi:hypothetical protein
VLFVAFETQPNTPSQYSNTSVHLFGWQGNTFQEITQQWLPGVANQVEGVGDVAFGDFNGDGRQDIFLSGYTDMEHPVNAYVLYNTGSGFNKVSMGLQTWQHSVRSYDINQDGYDDVIPVGYADMPRYMGTAQGLVKYQGFTGGSGLALGDFMNNGKASVIFVDAGQGLNDTYLYNFNFSTPGSVSVQLVSQLPGPRLESVAPTTSSHDIRAVPFDFNDDGLLDVVVIGYGFGQSDTATHRSEVQFLLNKGQGVFEDVTSTYRIGFDVGGGVGYTPQLVDVNQDGRLDLFLSMPDWLPRYNSTSLLLQQQDHTFVDSARVLLNTAIANGGGQGVLAKGPNNTFYLVTEGAWDRTTALTSVYLQRISFPERDASETLAGTRYDDQLFGLGGHDTLQGNAGNDSLDGGAGFDLATYNASRANYTITKASSSFNVADKTGATGVDTAVNIERLVFTDATVALDIHGVAGQAYRIYQAAFNRTPDNGGLKYWIGIMDNGVPLTSVSAGFIGSAEFQNLYGTNPTNELFVTKLYDNVLHRAPDTGGYNYWVGLLNSGSIDKVSTLVNFSESQENQAGVIGVIQNGIELFN